MYSDYRNLLRKCHVTRLQKASTGIWKCHLIIVLFFRLVASGSDDVQVIIWDPFLHKSVTTVRTGHQGNIFSVKVMTYVPKTPDADFIQT